ncbi:MAG: hypothetical protein Fur0032_20160 [Terrimicrobiaceae bacterium]
MRLVAKQDCPDLFKGERTRLIIAPVQDRLVALGVAPEKALEASKLFCSELGSLDDKAEKKSVLKVKTMGMFSPLELDKIAEEIKGLLDSKEKKQEEKIKKAGAAALKAHLVDAADIALFGRMVASDHSLTLEGAAMFSHALSTHKAVNDVDYWTAVDDRQKEDPTVAEEDRAGSGGMGTAEFTSATYYRYMGLNLDLLFDDDHLGKLGDEQRRSVLDAFLRATLTAIPGARKNSMNAATLPHAVLGIRKDKGQPLQLINAFESGVKANGKGLAEASKDEMKAHHEKLKATWGIQTTQELWLPDTPLDDFIGGLTDGL